MTNKNKKNVIKTTKSTGKAKQTKNAVNPKKKTPLKQTLSQETKKMIIKAKPNMSEAQEEEEKRIKEMELKAANYLGVFFKPRTYEKKYEIEKIPGERKTGYKIAVMDLHGELKKKDPKNTSPKLNENGKENSQTRQI